MPSTRRRLLALWGAGAAAGLAGCSLPGRPRIGTIGGEKVDDWQYDPDDGGGIFGGFAQAGGTDDALEMEADAAASGTGGSIGLAAGGAADVSTFRRNVREGYLPIPESIAYEGLFHEYYFDTGGDGSCASLFCPTYTAAVTPDPLSGETERYLSVGLDSGLAQSAFERPNLNLVIVLDVSGSMGASFAEYYYDRNGGAYYYDQHGNRREVDVDDPGDARPKMEVAKDALVSLTEHLRPDDRFGVVLFDSQAHVAKPLRTVGETDMDAIRGHIREDVRAGGGTNLSAALTAAEDVMAEFDDPDPAAYENRSILLTDAQINLGETNADALVNGLAENADRGHHTSVVGVGVDFNADLVDRLTAIEGANYYGVHTEEEFARRVDEEFEYMVTPLVYDLSLELHADDAEIARVYGSTAADEATGELMRVHTLFPSPRTDGEARGGVVLVQVDGPAGAELELEASWETRSGETRSTTETVSFPTDEEAYGNDAVRKAVLLARYADLLKRWSVAERDETLVTGPGGPDAGETSGDETDADETSGNETDAGGTTGGDSTEPYPEGIAPPSTAGLGRWEQRSAPLTVSDRYESRLRDFEAHFDAEASAIGDDALERELDVLGTILDAA